MRGTELSEYTEVYAGVVKRICCGEEICQGELGRWREGSDF